MGLIMPEPRLEHQTMKIRQLIDDYRYGRIVIPEFQREYVWKPGKAPKLIDLLTISIQFHRYCFGKAL